MTANDDLISIIMPVYNSQQYLAKSIESVINQTYKNWELFIIDDNSIDDSHQIALEFEKKFPNNIFILKTTKNSGPGTARNLGTKSSKGRYICFLDSDDMWYEDKLEKQIKFIKKYNYPIIFSNYEKISSNGKRANRNVILPKNVDYKDMLGVDSIPCLTAMYDVKMVGKLIQNEERKFIAYEDYLMWLYILKKGFIATNTNDILGMYRIADDSISRNKVARIFTRWDIYRNIEKLTILKSLSSMYIYLIKGFRKYLI